MILNLGNLILQPSFSEIISYGNNGTARSTCNCVVFRMDNIQDYWVRGGQLAAMNQFIFRNQSVTLGMIMGSIGEDTEIVNKIKQGSDSGLFKLAMHGWNFSEFTAQTEEEQRNSLDNSNKKMIEMFGNSSNILLPPYGAFNGDTINAMKQVGMNILSGNTSSFDQFELNGNNNESSSLSSSPIQSENIYYIPATISFKDYYGGQYIQNSLENIFNNATQSIRSYGYAVIVLDPQHFMQIEDNGSPTDIVDQNAINDLSRLIHFLSSNNTRIGSFAEITAGMEDKHIR
ncbi:MAG: polysaccharide deacetylase family protein [Thermoproteota archaeon]|nr:polysaccharide deacetylase family protein [Thermoproteota archaeon]